MGAIYYYKLTSDDGGAPCVEGGLLSLAICKPMIRSTAEKGDVIFGFAANSLFSDNRLLYIARVSNKERDGQYFINKRYWVRSDCIYRRRGDKYQWHGKALFHGPNDLVHDLGKYPGYRRANVLISKEFRYFGKSGSADYKIRYPAIKRVIEELGRGHRVRHGEALLKQLQSLEQDVWTAYPKKEVIGKSTTYPQPGVCHRSKSCGVIRVREPC